MCLSVSLKVLIRPWTALRWGNTMMIRSQHWWHLRRNGKTQNSSTPVCLAACVCPCVVWLALCWPTSKYIHVPEPSDSIQHFAFLIVDHWNENGTPWWSEPRVSLGIITAHTDGLYPSFSELFCPQHLAITTWTEKAMLLLPGIL